MFITVRLFGSLKKYFSADELQINNIADINSLIIYLIKIKPKNSPEIDFNNMIIAINGTDSNTLQGKITKLNTNDIVSIIPIIHGGDINNRIQFKILGYFVELIEVDKKYKIDFLNLQKKFPNIILQGIKSNYVLNKRHAKKIINISLLAKKNSLLLAKKLEIDIIMRFSCTTQIIKAIKIVGVRKTKTFIVIVIGNKNSLNKVYYYLKQFVSPIPFLQNNHLFLIKKFNISKNEINMHSISQLEDLLVEKAAILF